MSRPGCAARALELPAEKRPRIPAEGLQSEVRALGDHTGRPAHGRLAAFAGDLPGHPASSPAHAMKPL